MNPPIGLIEMLAALRPHEISFSYGGLKLFEAEELEEGQLGYSVGPKGECLCRNEKGAWRESWIVVGYDTGLGDPIFIDTAHSNLPVFTGVSGEGAWNPKLVANSLETFAQCWREFARIAEGRSSPNEEEASPLAAAERSRYLERVSEISGSRTAPEFWIDLLAYGEDEEA